MTKNTSSFRLRHTNGGFVRTSFGSYSKERASNTDFGDSSSGNDSRLFIENTDGKSHRMVTRTSTHQFLCRINLTVVTKKTIALTI